MNIDSAAAVKQQMNPNMIDPSKPEVGNAIGGGIQLPSTETSQLHSKRFGHPYHANPASLPDMESISPSPTTATACPTEPDPAKINAIWDNLNAAGCHPLPTRDQIRCLWSAPVDAPLTYETLLNLATPSIKTDRSLRHEMNYITDIKFFRKENRENPLTRQRLADEFWQALAIELCILQARSLQQRKRCLLQDTQPTFLGSIWPRFPQRLVKMSHELRDITPMVTQRPHQESLSTKDLDPIVYKTTRAISNVPSLLNVIEQLTQRSYQIGRREHDVDNANIRSRSFDIDADCFDAFKMARELRILFEGIERIKMIEAAEYVNTDRDALLQDYVSFEQKNVLKQLRDGQFIENWLLNDSKHVQSERGRFETFLNRFLHLIISCETSLPKALHREHARIRKLQRLFHRARFYNACRQIVHTLIADVSSREKLCTEQFRTHLLPRLDAIQDDTSLSTGPFYEAVSLELVQEAYIMADISSAPSKRHLNQAHTLLEVSLDPSTSAFEKIHEQTANELTRRFHEEIQTLRSLDTVQMARRYPSLQATVASTAAQEGSFSLLPGDFLPGKMAHMATLHWRVFGPILYHPKPQVHVQIQVHAGGD